MKVVLFCGGLGMRLREYSDRIPKPLAEIGSRPILWHLMKYYAHYGHKDFLLCLGYGAAAIKSYFVNYQEYVSNDFVLSGSDTKIQLLQKDLEDWRITFVDTGLHSNIGSRLMAVRKYLAGEDVFLANYADGLTDLDLGKHVDTFLSSGRTASFLSVAMPQSYHVVHADEQGCATKLEHVAHSSIRINGGFFAFRRGIFDYMRPGEELVIEPFQRLIAERELLAMPYTGFWRGMDTFKDKIELDDLAAKGKAPWQVWLPGQRLEPELSPVECFGPALRGIALGAAQAHQTLEGIRIEP
jgi:glucose-1-phosphate cytidylyltransferase